MKFNLFKLHSSEDGPNSWIWACLNPTALREEYLAILVEQKQNQIARKINQNLKVGISTIEKHLIKLKKSQENACLPLPIIIELSEIINKEDLKSKIIDEIKFFFNNSAHDNKTKAVNYLDETLAKIIGAHLADGYLKYENSTYRIKVCDGKREIVEKFCEWIKETFEISPIIRFSEKDNTWICWFNNKIIGRYFENIFDIPVGKKSHIIKEPDIIKNSNLDLRKSFALGVFTFDGGVKTTGMVAISLKSKQLIEDLYNILALDGIKVKKGYNKKKEFWMLESVTGRNKEYLKKWLDYFEQDTSKSKKLSFFIHPENHSIEEIYKLFPRHHREKINIMDVYDSMNPDNYENSREIAEQVSKNKGVSNTTVYKYLYILKNSGQMKGNQGLG